MIARTWHGRVPREKGDAYETFLSRIWLSDITATSGNRGVLLLRRDEREVTHFQFTSFWDSVESIKRFAGDDYQRARYNDEDRDFLLEFEPFVTHYDVLVAPKASQ